MRRTQPGPSQAPWENDPPYASREEAKGEKTVLIAVILISLVFFAVLGLLLYRRLSPDFGTNSPAVPPVSPVSPTVAVLPTPAPIPSPTPSPTAGISSAGTEVKDLVYTDSGKVASLRELLNGEWVDWVYVYDENGSFRYRYRNIGSVPSELTSHVMPGTDTTYSQNAFEVKNCIGFTLEFQVYQIIRGDGKGPRTLRLRSEGEWIVVDEFTYPLSGVYDLETFVFRFDEPITFDAFGAHRVNADESKFNHLEELTEVLVADYDYVCLG